MSHHRAPIQNKYSESGGTWFQIGDQPKLNLLLQHELVL